MKKYSYYIYFKSIPIAQKKIEDDIDDDVLTVCSQTSFEDIQRSLSRGVISYGLRQGKRLPKGVCIMQCSEDAECSEVVSLTSADIRELALHRCFFSYAICSSRWRTSGHRLSPFYVVQFSGEYEEKKEVRHNEYRRFNYLNRNFYIVGNNGAYSSLLKMIRNWQNRVSSSTSAKECRIDYFTKNPWVDLFVTSPFMNLFAKAQLSVSLCIHPTMAYSDKDADHALFSYILRNPTIRNYVNGRR